MGSTAPGGKGNAGSKVAGSARHRSLVRTRARVAAIVSWLLWPIDTIDVHCRKLCLGVLVGVGHGGNARQTALFIRRGNRWRRSSRRLFHHDFNRHRGNRSRLGPLEEPEQQNQSNDEMSRNRQSIGHAAVVGFLQKEMLQPLHHCYPVNRNCLNLALFYLRHAFGFNTFSVTRMCSDRQRVGLRPLQRCRLVAQMRSADRVAQCPSSGSRLNRSTQHRR